LPELSCTKGSSEPEDDCIDMMKLRQVNQTFSKHLQEYYYSMFGYAKIKLVQMYPLPKTELTIYDLPRPLNITGEAFSYTPTHFVVTLRDQLQGGEKVHYGYGYVEVGVYE